MCGVAKKLAHNTVSILTGRKKLRFSHIRSFVLPLRNKAIFAVQTHPPTLVVHIPHSSKITSSIHKICNFKNWLSFFIFFLSFFFLFLHTYKNCYKTQTPNPIALQFGTQKGGIKAHLCTNFGWNTINSQSVICYYSQKITPICCHTYRVNHLWEEAE